TAAKPRATATSVVIRIPSCGANGGGLRRGPGPRGLTLRSWSPQRFLGPTVRGWVALRSVGRRPGRTAASPNRQIGHEPDPFVRLAPGDLVEWYHSDLIMGRDRSVVCHPTGSWRARRRGGQRGGLSASGRGG